VLQLDAVEVGPREVARGPLLGDPVSYTPTISGFGTVSAVSFTWARMGKYLYLSGTFTAGTTAASAARITIPFTIDSGISSNGLAVGGWTTTKTTTNANRNSATAFVKLSNGTNFISASNVGDGSTAENLDEINGGQLWTNSSVVSVFAMIPIQGWGSNVVTSSDSGTRVVSSTIGLSANQTVSTTNNTTITFDTVRSDKTGIFSLSNNGFVVRESGDYEAKLICYLTSITASENFSIKINVNGSTEREMFYPPASTVGSYQLNIPIHNLKAGDIVTASVDSVADASYTVDSSSSRTSFSLTKVQSPQSIGMADPVIAIYRTDAGQSIPDITSTIINYEDKVHDTHGAVTVGASWKFTAPVPGIYEVKAMCFLSNTTNWAVGEIKSLTLFKNGSSHVEIDYHEHYATDGSSSYTHIVNGSTMVKLLAGDYIDIQIVQNSDAALALLADGPSNQVSIVKVG
jgi:hypothetical protein